jgi:hypothetical protein
LQFFSFCNFFFFFFFFFFSIFSHKTKKKTNPLYPLSQTNACVRASVLLTHDRAMVSRFEAESLAAVTVAIPSEAVPRSHADCLERCVEAAGEALDMGLRSRRALPDAAAGIGARAVTDGALLVPIARTLGAMAMDAEMGAPADRRQLLATADRVLGIGSVLGKSKFIWSHVTPKLTQSSIRIPLQSQSRARLHAACRLSPRARRPAAPLRVCSARSVPCARCARCTTGAIPLSKM